MATYLQRTYIPQEKRQDTNFPLLAQVMQMKQGSYDANRAKIQQTLDAFGIQSQQVLRDEDKEYMAAKLSSITSQINDYGNKDLSQSSVTEDLMGNIRAAASDPIIQNAIQNTQKFNTFQKQVATLKEKEPELYSDINYQYALESAGLKGYMEGKTNTVGDLNYTPYNDYNKTINDNIIDLLGKKGKRTTQQRVLDSSGNPTGELQEVEIDGLSPDQLRVVAESMLTAKDMQQIEIDGWYNNGGFDNPNILSSVQAPLNKRMGDIDEQVTKYRIKADQLSADSPKRKQYLSDITKLEQEKINIEKNIDVFTKDPKAASTFLEREKVINGITARFAPLYTESNSIVKDDAYWARMNYNLDLAKEQRLSREAQNKLVEDRGSFSQAPLPTPTEGTELEAAETVIQNQIDATSTELDTTFRQFRTELEKEALNKNPQAQEQWKILNGKLQNKDKNQSDVSIIQEFVLSNNSNVDALVLRNDKGENLKAKVRSLTQRQDFEIRGYQMAKKQAKDRHIDTTINSEQTFKAFHENPNTTMGWNGKVVPVHQVLKSEGLMDENGNKIGDLNNKPIVSQELQKSYYASAILNNMSPVAPLKEERALSELSSIFGENKNNVVQTEFLGIDNRSGSPRYRTTINSNTKTGQYLLKAQANGVYDTFGFQDNALVGDDSDIEQFITKDYRQDPLYKQDLERFRTKIGSQQMLGFSFAENEEDFNELMRTAQTVNSNFNQNKNSVIRIRQNGQNVIIENKNKDTQGEDQGVSQVEIDINTFQKNHPELSQQLDFASDSAIYTYERIGKEPLPSEEIKYIQSKSDDLYDWVTEEVLTGAKQKYVPFLTEQDTRTQLLKNYPDLKETLPQFTQVIDTLLTNSTNYAVHLQFSGSQSKPKLNLKLIHTKSKDEIHSLTIPNMAEADDFHEILKETPQVYFGLLLDNLFTKQRFDYNQTGEASPEYIKLIKSLNNK